MSHGSISYHFCIKRILWSYPTAIISRTREQIRLIAFNNVITTVKEWRIFLDIRLLHNKTFNKRYLRQFNVFLHMNPPFCVNNSITLLLVLCVLTFFRSVTSISSDVIPGTSIVVPLLQHLLGLWTRWRVILRNICSAGEHNLLSFLLWPWLRSIYFTSWSTLRHIAFTCYAVNVTYGYYNRYTWSNIVIIQESAIWFGVHYVIF